MILEPVSDAKLKVDVEMTLTREQVMSARASDTPLMVTPQRQMRLNAGRVIAEVERRSGYELARRCRRREALRYRAALANALHRHPRLDLSWSDIGAMLGLRDASHAAMRVRRLHPDLCARVTRWARQAA